MWPLGRMGRSQKDVKLGLRKTDCSDVIVFRHNVATLVGEYVYLHM